MVAMITVVIHEPKGEVQNQRLPSPKKVQCPADFLTLAHKGTREEGEEEEGETIKRAESECFKK